jgi:hypothetical protein
MTTNKTMTKEEKLQKWEEISAQAKELKALEMKLRNEVLYDFFEYEGDDRKGTTNFPLGGDCKLKAEFKLYYKLENKDGETLDMLDELSANDENGDFVSSRLVKWEPKLSISEYNKLSPEQKKIVDRVLTVTPGTPSISIVYPKEK